MSAPTAEGGDPDGAALDLFISRAERSASIVHRCAGAERLARLIAGLSSDARLVASPTFAVRYPAVVDHLRPAVEVVVPESPAEVAGASLGVSVGEGLVVETGSVLVAERDLPDRLVSMLSPTLVQVVDENAIIHTLDDVAVILRRMTADGTPGYLALVTGPSRSADIERSLTIGVQGPAELHIVIYRTD